MDLKQNGPFTGFDFLSILKSRSEGAQFSSRFFSPSIAAHNPVMLANMVSTRQVLKVLDSVVRFLFVDVVDVFFWIEVIHPALGHHSVNKSIPADF